MEPFQIHPLKLRESLSSFFLEREEILFAYLFGSFIRGRMTPLSDMDIAIFVDLLKIREGDHPYGYAATLTSDLMGFVQTNRVDVILLNEASPLLRHRIFSEGERIFCRDKEKEKRFFVRSLHDYCDTAPLRHIQWLYLKRRLENLGPPSSRG